MSRPRPAAAAFASPSPSPDPGRRAGFHRPRQAVPPPPAAALKPCACGHGRQAHQHYRAGKDCALCSCARYHRGLFSRLFR
jgi:hypothetical protein